MWKTIEEFPMYEISPNGLIRNKVSLKVKKPSIGFRGYPVVSLQRNGNQWEYATDTLLNGHGDKSVMVLAQYFKLTEEEIMCIRYHMGAFCDKSEWNDYTRAVHKYTNVLWTHQADMLASHVEGV